MQKHARTKETEDPRYTNILSSQNIQSKHKTQKNITMSSVQKYKKLDQKAGIKKRNDWGLEDRMKKQVTGGPSPL